MCGIAGIVALRNALDVTNVVREMTTRVRHRGPDDEGFYVRGRVALGHRRLSIIDLSAAGRQPMSSADGRYVVTYNGEIYNYIELRLELEAQGVHFQSATDTEVIIAAYTAWGKACLSRFNGMWAFAIYDSAREVIFAARDRFGVKPFYYVRTDVCFAFGSEIRQLLPLLPSVKANPATVADFLLTGVHVQSAETFFAGVSELNPGCFLVYDVGSDQCEIEQWYHLLDGVEKKALNEQSDAEAVAELRDLLEDAVRLRLRSDVRVGTCLSGGLDSSSIALLAAQMQRMASNQLFTAVTAVSEDPRNSEEDYAEKVVRAGSLDWVKTRPSYDDFQDLLPRVIEHQEEPFASPSVCMQAFVMQAAAERGIVVLLDGQGGDETLLGYDKYYPAYCVALWQEGGAREVLQGVLRSMRSNVNMRPWRFAAHCLFALVPKARHLYYVQRAGYLTSRPPLPEWVRQFSAACFEMRRLQALEVGTTSLPALLRYEDKNSMAWSIEARLPFLDYRLVEMAVALAAGLKIRNGWTKWALRSAMRDILPHEIAWRRNKIGFEAPNDLWLARHLETMTEKVRRSHLIGRFCNVDRLMQCYRTLDHNSQWRLYSLALWEEHFGVQA